MDFLFAFFNDIIRDIKRALSPDLPKDLGNMDEHLAFAYQDAYGFPVTLLRFFGSYGPRQHLTWWGGPQAVFIDAVLNDKVIPIHGDGKQTRSFTYVSDTIDGIYAAMVREQANGEVLNLGSTEEITILELAQKIKRLSNTPGDLKVEFIPYESFAGGRYEDVMRRVPDTRLSEKVNNRVTSPQAKRFSSVRSNSGVRPRRQSHEAYFSSRASNSAPWKCSSG